MRRFRDASSPKSAWYIFIRVLDHIRSKASVLVGNTSEESGAIENKAHQCQGEIRHVVRDQLDRTPSRLEFGAS